MIGKCEHCGKRDELGRHHSQLICFACYQAAWTPPAIAAIDPGEIERAAEFAGRWTALIAARVPAEEPSDDGDEPEPAMQLDC